MDSIAKNSWLKRKAAANLLREAGLPVSRSTLETAAHRGTGPKYKIVAGHACYRREWLDEWLAQNTRR